ncbi:hypothetical protein ACA910_019822 [Epithemia clementina (nom. ined.)]
MRRYQSSSSSWMLLGLISSAAVMWSSSNYAVVRAQSADSKMPPPFFLQDPTDSLCLAGEEFKRCSIDTLWYATGTQGAYQIHKRPLDGVVDEQDDGLCLSKKSCKESDMEKMMDAKVTKCSNCGAKGWNILGENEVGYTLLTDDGKTCLARLPSTNNNNAGGPVVNDKAVTAPCDGKDTPLTTLQLQFASASDISTMSSPGARLVTAAADGDKKMVQSILKEEGVSVNDRDWDGLTALIPAASAGHLDLCKFLVKTANIDVNAADKDGITALMEASIMGHVKIVEFLIENGATVDETAKSGITALWLAASEGQDEVVKVLLNKGHADPTNTRIDGISALMTAAVGGHASMVKLLLEQPGVNATATDKEGLTPLMNSAEKGDVDVVKALLDSIPAEERASYVNQFSATGFTALVIASAHGHTKAVDVMLDYGADASIGCQDSGVTALMYAAANKQLDVVKLLLDKGKADVDQRHNGRGTALIEAGSGGAVEAMKLLVEAGANIDAKDEDGVSPLMGIASTCVLEGQEYIWGLLEKAGLAEKEINRMSFSGGTPIMFAAAGGHTSCVKFFIDHGAEVNVRSKATPEYLAKLEQHHFESGSTQQNENERHVDDVTPLIVAVQGGHLECAQALLDAGADPTLVDAEGRTALTLAIKGNYGEVAIALVKAGADPNMPFTDEEGVEHNLLFDSIMVENEEFAKVLIEKGADLYHKDAKLVTTLLQASHRGLTEVAQMLVDAHASRGNGGTFLDDASDEGVTPLIAASSEGHEAVVALLLKAGANVNAKDQDGTTALMAAAARGHLPIVQALIANGASVNEQNQDGHSALMFAFNGKNQVQTLLERYEQYYEEQKQQAATGDDGQPKEDKELEDDGGTGPIIKEALSNHTALVDFLLGKGADASLKDKEGHVAKDFDYQADNPAVFTKGTLGSDTAASSSSSSDVKEEL